MMMSTSGKSKNMILWQFARQAVPSQQFLENNHLKSQKMALNTPSNSRAERQYNNADNHTNNNGNYDNTDKPASYC